jgi:UDP-3-O-[3-hydroxymyristoyl] glucosamine N-acyltransferase
MRMTLQEIANLIDGSIEGDSSKEIYGLNSLENADFNQISHAVSQSIKKP